MDSLANTEDDDHLLKKEKSQASLESFELFARTPLSLERSISLLFSFVLSPHSFTFPFSLQLQCPLAQRVVSTITHRKYSPPHTLCRPSTTSQDYSSSRQSEAKFFFRLCVYLCNFKSFTRKKVVDILLLFTKLFFITKCLPSLQSQLVSSYFFKHLRNKIDHSDWSSFECYILTCNNRNDNWASPSKLSPSSSSISFIHSLWYGFPLTGWEMGAANSNQIFSCNTITCVIKCVSLILSQVSMAPAIEYY